jgi:3',5'-cyclic-AMP phosphodiesterase
MSQGARDVASALAERLLTIQTQSGELRTMRRIAHLSDLHILDPRPSADRGRYRVATRIVGLGRAVSPSSRTEKLARALSYAKERHADHFVISGDLTEVGTISEFEEVARVIHEAKICPDDVTLVPGNHDAYTASDGWRRAIEGPLAAFARASASRTRAGAKVVDRGPVAFLPIDSTRFQSIAWSGGIFTKAHAEAIERRAADPAFRDKALAIVLHHPPFYPRGIASALAWFDGLRGCAEVLELLRRHPRLQLLHGHLHRMVDLIVAGSSVVRASGRGHPTRVFGAPATCSPAPAGRPPVRLYDLDPGSGALAAA